MANRFFPNYPDYIITSKFGMRTLRGVTKMHRGIDLVATKDGKVGRTDYITAHTGGKVITKGYNSTSGNYLKIETEPGVVMLYCHFKSISVSKGDTVTQGQKLGYMGATGNATGAHLHFGLSVDGEYIDPQPYLDTDFTRQPKPNPEPNPEPQEDTVTVTLPVLKRGDKGDQIKPVQRMLHCLGYDLGDKPIDGSFGPATEKAVKKYQERYGLKVNGVADEDTWKQLLAL